MKGFFSSAPWTFVSTRFFSPRGYNFRNSFPRVVRPVFIARWYARLPRWRSRVRKAVTWWHSPCGWWPIATCAAKELQSKNLATRVRRIRSLGGGVSESAARTTRSHALSFVAARIESRLCPRLVPCLSFRLPRWQTAIKLEFHVQPLLPKCLDFPSISEKDENFETLPWDSAGNFQCVACTRRASAF